MFTIVSPVCKSREDYAPDLPQRQKISLNF